MPADVPVARRSPLRPDRPAEVSQIPSAPASRQAMSSQTWATTGGRGVVAIQGVERGDAVRLGRRDREASRDVVERRLADPADPVLDGVEGREQLVARGPRGVPAARGVAVDAGSSRAADPAGLGRPEDRVDRGPLGGEASGPMTCRSIAAEV